MVAKKYEIEEAVKLYEECEGNIELVSTKLNVDSSGLRRRLIKAGVHKPKTGAFATVDDSKIEHGSNKGRKTHIENLPPSGKISRYILTCVQSNTKLHTNFWENLAAYANQINARIMVSQYSYNKASYGDKATKVGKGATADDKKALWYPEELKDYYNNERVQLAPDLIWCGEQNVMPTAINPLSGFDSYCGESSIIIPHATIAMHSVATLEDRPKLLYTTGTASLKNYVQKKSGILQEFHHSFAALLVEVDEDGNWWVRQLIADDRGAFCDISNNGAIRVKSGKINKAKVEACVFGDIHTENSEPYVVNNTWKKGGIIDKLKPKYQMAHDILDFSSRNHHDRNNPHRNYEKFIEGRDGVDNEIIGVAKQLELMHRSFCKTVVVDSNHDRALKRWLAEADYKSDPLNAEIFLELQLALYKSIREGSKDFNVFEYALLLHDDDKVVSDCKFLKPNESFKVKGIELSMHGDRGNNGSRGNLRAFARTGSKSVVGHSHSAGISQGCWQVGTYSLLRLSYNEGLSSWSHSFAIIFENGKRQMITFNSEKPWADFK